MLERGDHSAAAIQSSDKAAGESWPNRYGPELTPVRQWPHDLFCTATYACRPV